MHAQDSLAGCQKEVAELRDTQHAMENSVAGLHASVPVASPTEFNRREIARGQQRFRAAAACGRQPGIQGEVHGRDLGCVGSSGFFWGLPARDM